MKISEDDVKRLFDKSDDFLGPNDDWEGFDIAKDDKTSEAREIPSKSEPIKVKKADRKMENEITIKKVRKKIAKTPEGSGGYPWNHFAEGFLKLLAFAGISGFLVFVSLNIPAYYSQLKWLYYTEYLGERMPGIVASKTPNSRSQQKYSATPQGAKTTIPTVFLDDPQSLLTIGKINVSSPITWNVDEDKIIGNLIGGVAHYGDTSLPGQGGNVFIVGHSSNFPWIQSDYNHIFSLLDKLINGDRINLNYAGKTYTYEVVEKKVVSASNVEVLNSTNQEVLSLMTCWPVGTTLNRLLIISKLVQIS